MALQWHQEGVWAFQEAWKMDMSLSATRNLPHFVIAIVGMDSFSAI
jgi:hypothetical protein